MFYSISMFSLLEVETVLLLVVVVVREHLLVAHVELEDFGEQYPMSELVEYKRRVTDWKGVSLVLVLFDLLNCFLGRGTFLIVLPSSD